MAQWGVNDAASNSVLWAPQQLKKTANTTNRDALFGNTTANAFVTGATIGQYAVDGSEIAAAQGGIAHTGWVLRTAGSGGRAGRVMTEVLVAGGITGDASDDAVMPDYRLTFGAQPADASGNSTAEETVTFASYGVSTPAGASISLLWQYTSDPGNTETWATTVGVTGFSGQTSNTLSVNTAAFATGSGDGTLFRLQASATGATTNTSSSGTLTVTT
jgi:hypothetical protein